MKQIRPFELFTRDPAPPPERLITMKLPFRRDLFALETCVLLCAARLVRARRFFEFGTFLGTTTLNLALNAPEDAEIFTLDLPAEEAKMVTRSDDEGERIRERLSYGGVMDFTGLACAGKIKQLAGDSRTFDFSPFAGYFDLIFIDGGHSLETVSSDTANAFRMIGKGRPACIFWHDYGNPDCLANTRFLDEFSEQIETFHVQETMLVGWFNDEARER